MNTRPWILFTCLVACACSPVRGVEGWMQLEQSALRSSPVLCATSAAAAVVCRDGETNALAIAISPGQPTGLATSWQSATYRVVLRFETRRPLPPGEIATRMPLLHGEHFHAVVARGDPQTGTLFLTFDASPLGLDLVWAALASPHGLAGFAQLGGEGVLPMRGRLHEPGQSVARVWRGQGIFEDFALVESAVEYPLRLSRDCMDTATSLCDPIPGLAIYPYESRWVRMCTGCAGKWNFTRVLAARVPPVPGWPLERFPISRKEWP